MLQSSTALGHLPDDWLMTQAASRFMTTFDLNSHGVLPAVQQLMCPDAGRLVARLDQASTDAAAPWSVCRVTPLSTCAARCHDTQRQQQQPAHGHDASLRGRSWPAHGLPALAPSGRSHHHQPGRVAGASGIACLLQPKHQPAPEGCMVQAMLNWGATLQAQSDSVQWIFLGMGTDFELQPLTGGYRVLLMYSVSGSPAVQEPSTLLDCAVSPFGCALRSALDDKGFMPEGGHLRFACQRIQYEYADTQRFSAADLRGADLAVYEAARQLSVAVKVQRVWEHGPAWDAGQDDTEHEPQLDEPVFSEPDSEGEAPPVVVWVSRPHFHPDAARVELGHSWLSIGKSSCMLTLHIEPFGERCRP